MKKLERQLYYSKPEVCRLYGIHRNTFNNWVKKGMLSTIRINNRTYVPYGSILALNERSEVQCNKINE